MKNLSYVCDSDEQTFNEHGTYFARKFIPIISRLPLNLPRVVLKFCTSASVSLPSQQTLRKDGPA